MIIVDWLSNNYQWVFSGVGVAVFIPLFAMFINRMNKVGSQNEKDSEVSTFSSMSFSQETQIQNKNEDKTNILDITAQEIAQKKDHLSEIEFEEYFNSLSGHCIVWEGEIGTVAVNKYDKSSVTIQMTFDAKALRTFFDINISVYPNVRLFKSGDRAVVSGVITSPDWPIFDLLNPKILNWTKK